VFNMSMISRYILLYLKSIDMSAVEDDIELGKLYLTAGSLHLYEKNVKKAFEIITEPALQNKLIEPFDVLPGTEVVDLDQFVDVLKYHAA